MNFWPSFFTRINTNIKQLYYLPFLVRLITVTRYSDSIWFAFKSVTIDIQRESQEIFN